MIITAHWETHIPSFTGGSHPGLPALAQRATDLIVQSGVPAVVDPDYGWDHGVFIPLKVMYPQADIPVVVLTLIRENSACCL